VDLYFGGVVGINILFHPNTPPPQMSFWAALLPIQLLPKAWRGGGPICTCAIVSKSLVRWGVPAMGVHGQASHFQWMPIYCIPPCAACRPWAGRHRGHPEQPGGQTAGHRGAGGPILRCSSKSGGIRASGVEGQDTGGHRGEGSERKNRCRLFGASPEQGLPKRCTLGSFPRPVPLVVLHFVAWSWDGGGVYGGLIGHQRYIRHFMN